MAGENFKRIVHILERSVLGSLSPNLKTPHHIIYWGEKSKLIHYFPFTEVTYPVPLIIIPPLMVKPDIYDLHPGHSMVGYLLSKGFDVYLIDFGIPGPEDKDISVDDFVATYIRTAVEETLRFSGKKKISMLGWSMGGIMTVLYGSLYNRDGHLKNAIVMGAPVDYSKMFPINLMVKLGGPFVEPFTKIIGNIPGFLSSSAFKLSSPLVRIRRYFQLLNNFHDREWVQAYERVEQWIDEFIPYPGGAFRKFVLEFIKDDKLKKGEIKIRGRKVKTKNFTSNLLIIAGITDWIAPFDACVALRDMVSSKDIGVLSVPLGHLGMVAGHRANDEVWKNIVKFLEKRSE